VPVVRAWNSHCRFGTVTFVSQWREQVSDAIFLVIGLGFFVASFLYLFACERL